MRRQERKHNQLGLPESSRYLSRAISREELLNEVWGYQNYPSTRTVDNHILRLRQKLEADPANPQHFLTLHRSGYKFVPTSGQCQANG
jgi:DNA-binding response OmpR family regulator